MKIIALPRNQFELRATYSSPVVYALYRAIPGVQRIDGKTYRGYRDAMSLLCDAMHAKGLRFDFKALSAPETLPDPLWPLAVKGLRDYQITGAKYLIAKGEEGCILGDGMRLGKTAQAITAMRALDSKVVVVCPSYVRGVWRDELRKWWPALKEEEVFFPSGAKPGTIPYLARVIVIHYDILSAWVEALCQFEPRIACFDEGHLLQNESTARSKAARKLAAAARLRWALTGTPQTNRIRDLHNLVDTLCPGRFGDFFKFGLRYCDAHQEAVTPTKTVWKFDGESYPEELHQRLSTFMLRRIASDPEIALQLPPKTRQTVWVDVKAKKALSLQTSARALRDALDRSADAKLPAVLELLAGHLESGVKVVAFCWRRAVVDFLIDSLRGQGYPCTGIHGGVSAARRGKAIAEAGAAEGAFLLAATIDCASVGIDLSFADVCVFCELTYEPHELLQAEARPVKYGTSKGCLFQYVLARGTVDEIIASRVIDKLEVFEKVVGASGESLAGLRETSEKVEEDIFAAIEAMKGEKQ